MIIINIQIKYLKNNFWMYNLIKALIKSSKLIFAFVLENSFHFNIEINWPASCFQVLNNMGSRYTKQNFEIHNNLNQYWLQLINQNL